MRRFLGWLLVVVVVLAVVIVAAFKLSPWPSVAIVSYAFSKGDRGSEAALVKHVPIGIETRRDLAYGSGPDEVFDINRPANTTSPLPAIVWVHGGGWIAGSKDGVANYLKVLAGHDYVPVGLEYSTGFGTTYPKPVEQVNAALGYLAAHADDLGIDPNLIILAGDSAGAQIAAQIAILTTDPSYASHIGIAPQLQPRQLVGVLLLSGAYDLGSIDLNGDYGWFLKTVLWAYSGTENFLEDERFRLASVTDHMTKAFPPAFISSGNGDPLAPQAIALTRKLQTLDVHVESLFFPANYEPPLPHEYQFNLDIEPGQQALDKMLAFMASTVAGSKRPSGDGH